MKKIKLNTSEYEVVSVYQCDIDQEIIQEKMTEYFDEYDYVFGDWAYGKLRLKGFNDKTNKNFNEINDINKLEEYIKKNCAYECKHFLLKKIS